MASSGREIFSARHPAVSSGGSRDEAVGTYLPRLDLVDIAPHPSFSRLNRSDKGMLATMKMFGRMLIL